jgi:hypothetical protein
MISNPQLRSDLLELDRQHIPGMFSGLYAVLALFHDPLPEQLPHQSKGAADKRIVDLTSDGINVLDLTLTADGIEVVDLT